MKKLAFPTDDAKTISPHFGQAQFFLVANLHDDGSVTFEQREKPVHRHDHYGSSPDSQAHGRANGIFAVIEDCQVLISRGMGQPAYDRALASGIEVFLVAEKDILTALNAYKAGTLSSDLRRIHRKM